MTEPDLTLHGALELSKNFPSKIGICVLSVTGANISNGHLVSTHGSLWKLWFKKWAKCLTLSGMKITAGDVILVKSIVANVGMRTLTLQSCTLDVDCMKNILGAANKKCIQYLDMTGTKVDMEVAKVLENYIWDNSPKKLTLRSCSVTSDECKIILGGFKHNSKIEVIDLRENQLDESAVSSICRVMKETTINLLRLGQCGLSENDKLTLGKEKPWVTELNLEELPSNGTNRMIPEPNADERPESLARPVNARGLYNISLYRQRTSNILALMIEHSRESDERYPEYAHYETTMNRTPVNLLIGGNYVIGTETMHMASRTEILIDPPESPSFSETKLWRDKCVVKRFRIIADTDGITHHRIVLKEDSGETVRELFDLKWPWPAVPKESGDTANVVAKEGGIVVSYNKNSTLGVNVSEDKSERYEILSDSNVESKVLEQQRLNTLETREQQPSQKTNPEDGTPV